MIIQKAESGGKIFYRLRASGFNDISDARQFCTAISDKVACIPVVTRWMLSEPIKNAVIFGCEGPNLTDVEFNFFAETSPFGFILFSRNIVNAKQVNKLCLSLRDAVGWQAPILIDQEGG